MSKFKNNFSSESFYPDSNYYLDLDNTSKKDPISEDQKSNKGGDFEWPNTYWFIAIPKFLGQFLSPVGVLLIGGLIHDYGYKYETLLLKNKKTIGIKTQKWMDETFRDINIEVNGFYFLNYLAYWALRLGGFVAWNKHRKVNAKIGD